MGGIKFRVKGKTQKSNIVIQRENSLKKKNWNAYVGDDTYKTDRCLSFMNSKSNGHYERESYVRNLKPLRALTAGIGLMFIVIFLSQSIRTLFLSLQSYLTLGSMGALYFCMKKSYTSRHIRYLTTIPLIQM